MDAWFTTLASLGGQLEIPSGQFPGPSFRGKRTAVSPRSLQSISCRCPTWLANPRDPCKDPDRLASALDHAQFQIPGYFAPRGIPRIAPRVGRPSLVGALPCIMRRAKKHVPVTCLYALAREIKRVKPGLSSRPTQPSLDHLARPSSKFFNSVSSGLGAGNPFRDRKAEDPMVKRLTSS